MARLWVLFSVLTIIGSTAALNEGIFTGLIPTRIFKDSSYTIWIAGDAHSNDPPPPLDIYIQCSLRGRIVNFLIGHYQHWSANEPIKAEIQTQNLFAQPYESCQVVAVHLITRNVLNAVPVTLVDETKDGNSNSLFIQMDKPAYKPGDTVNIRIVTLDGRHLPKTSIPLYLSIRDAKNITIDKMKVVQEGKENGIRRYTLTLGKRLNLGPWTLTVNSGDLKKVLTFVVEKYVLPKFVVKVTPTPNYLVAGKDSALTVGVQASYTYGKSLAGNCSVMVYPAGKRPKEGLGNPTKADLTNGKVFIQFSIPLTFGMYTVEANVSESKTGRWALGKTSLHVYNTEPFKIIWLNPVDTFKPGFPLEIQLAVSTVDNFPVSDAGSTALSITNTHNSRNTVIEVEKLFSPIPANGIVTFKVQSPSDAASSFHSLTVNYKQVSHNLKLPRVFQSTSKLQVRISANAISSQDIQRGQRYGFTIETRKYFSNLVVNYVLYDGVKIIDFQVNQPITRGAILPEGYLYNLNIIIPQAIYTELKIFVFFVHHFGSQQKEIISASTAFPTSNYIDLKLSREVLEPTENISLTFRTHPGSTIALRGIDQSVLLLSQDLNNADLDPATVPNSFFWKARKSIGESYVSKYSSDFLEEFQQNGLEILTNLKKEPRRNKREILQTHSRQTRQADNDVERFGVIDYDFHKGPVRIRTDFPEVWLWEEIEAENEITVYQPKVPKVPDTITSWYLTAFSVNKQSGLAVTPFPKILNVFRPFFVTLNLPYSVIKGETFALQVLVHNYFDEEIWTTVTFINSAEDFQFVDTNERSKDIVTKQKRLAPHTVDVVQFVMTPLKLGQLPIHVKAVTAQAGDALIRPLNVLAPGVTYPANKINKMIQANNKRGDGSFEHTERIVTRTKRSLESRSLKFTADAIAPICNLSDSSNIGGLIHLPTDCGEQSMSKFYPDILALDHLESLGELTREKRSAGIENLRRGYMRQLEYYNTSTGSFKYFPNGGDYCSDDDDYEYSDEDDDECLKPSKPSTWLTAFVLRCFAGTSKYITIDPLILVNGLKFLVGHQDGGTGEFFEYGKNLYPIYFVRQTSLVGGAEKEVFRYAITAYVTLAMTEIYDMVKPFDNTILSTMDRRNIEESIVKGLKYISSDSCHTESDAYSLAIVTATLHATNHTAMDRFYQKLETYAVSTKDKDGEELKHYELKPSVPEKATTAMTIEITAYALLTHLWRSQTAIGNSLPIVKWLFSKRNSKGGFLSTQDTVVGLTALSKYAKMSRLQPNETLDISIATSTQDVLNFQMQGNDSLAVEGIILPEMLNEDYIDVTVRGKGRVFMEYEELHYTSKPKVDESQFKIKAKWLPSPEDEDAFDLNVCVSATQEEPTGDVVTEVNLPSGYAFDAEEMEYFMKQNQNPSIQRVVSKEKGTKGFIYYASINQAGTCVSLRVTRLYHIVSKNKAGISVYEYMDPNKRSDVRINQAVTTTVCELCLETKECDLVNGCARRRR